VINDIAAKMNQEENLPAWAFRVSAHTAGHIIRRIREGLISAKTGKSLLATLWEEGRRESEKGGQNVHGGHEQRVDELIAEGGLTQISDSGELERLADQVIAANPQQTADYRSGKEKAFNSLVGQVMKASKGKANPQQVTAILKKKLEA
jgi:aspartyl-tRNA(Asn)/glutamyl-tRNA(Gln) amidotransferase subunit B